MSEEQALKVKARFFASSREAVGQRELDMEVAEGTTIRALLQRLTSDHPKLAGYASFLMVAVNAEYVGMDRVLCAGDEIAFIPPVSGGCHV